MQLDFIKFKKKVVGKFVQLDASCIGEKNT